MATQPGAAQRRGGTKQRQYNEDRTVGARSGVPIPEMSRDDDDFEDFEKLIDAGLHGRDLPAIERPHNQKQGPPGKRKSTFSKIVDDGDGERSMDLTDVHHTPRTVAPLSSQATRSPAMPRPRTVDFDSVPSPRTTRNLSGHDSRNSTYSGRVSAYGGFRSMAGPPEDLGDIDPDAYIDYTGGGQDQPSSPLAVISPPPALARKSPISSHRSPTPERPARSPARGATPRARHSATLRESNGVTDEHHAPKESTRAIKGHSSRLKSRSPDPVDEQYDAPDPLDVGGGYEDDERGDMDDGSASRDPEPLEDHNRDQRKPTKARMESFDDDNGDDDDAPLAQKKKAPKDKQVQSKKAKPKEPQKVSKKRARDDDQENVGQPKKKKPPTSKTSSKPRSKAEPIPDQSFFEELEPPSDVEEFEEVGVRRSARCRFAPVAFWRGEKLEYAPWKPGTERQCPEIRGVRRVREEPFWRSRRAPNKKQARGRGRSLTAEYDEENAQPPEFEWDKDTPRDGVVVDLFTEEELRRRLICTAHMLQPRYTANGDFAFQKILSDGEFVAAGYVEIPVGKAKPRKSTKDNTYIFYVIEGAVLVEIHNDEYLLAPGSIFMVPRGNYYFIQNISKRKVKLFFAQGRQVEAEEDMSSRFPSEAADAPPTKQRRSEPYEEIVYNGSTAVGSRASAISRSYPRARSRESASPRKRGQSQPTIPARRR